VTPGRVLRVALVVAANLVLMGWAFATATMCTTDYLCTVTDCPPCRAIDRAYWVGVATTLVVGVLGYALGAHVGRGWARAVDGAGAAAIAGCMLVMGRW